MNQFVDHMIEGFLLLVREQPRRTDLQAQVLGLIGRAIDDHNGLVEGVGEHDSTKLELLAQLVEAPTGEQPKRIVEIARDWVLARHSRMLRGQE